MKTVSYSLMAVGAFLFLVGVGAAFAFDQPSAPFSLVWWLTVGGWCIAMVGIGIHAVRFFKMLRR
jgi:hypothetical protein